ncbi:triple tyrosine motif-containing protein [Wenyingzhuangia sp. IMCC45467]
MKSLYCFIVLLFLTNFIGAQELPPIRKYTSKDYHAENQNWAISQAENKYVYIANNKGLLEYNGACWNLYPSPNQTIVRAVKVINNYIYIGFYNGFGFWKKNNFGVLEYNSLSNDVNFLEDEQIWHIETLDDYVLFQSLQRIYIYHLKTKTHKIIQVDSQITSMFKVDDVIYYQEHEKGIYKLEKGTTSLVSKNNLFLKHDVVSIHNYKHQLVFVTANKGIYSLENGVLKEWNVVLNKLIKDYRLYSSIQLTNGNLALGTISNGVLVYDEQLGVKFLINKEKGLSDNTVLSLFEDIDNNVWLGLDDGINILNLNSPFKVFKDTSGVLGTVYTSIIHNGFLYLGTNQGLFCRKKNSQNDFELVKNTEGQVWELKNINGDLLCGHNNGTFIINNNKAVLIGNIMGTWKITPLSNTTFIQGNYTGLSVFEKKQGIWKFKNKLKGFDVSSRYFEILDKNTLFVNHEYKGIYKLTINDSLTKITQVDKMTSVAKGLHSSLLTYKGDVLYSYQNGIYKYNKEKDLFVKDTVLSSYISSENYTTGVLINMPLVDKLWGFSKKEICYIEQGTLSTQPIIHRISMPLSLRKGASGYENICKLTKDTYLLGTSYGYIVVNINDLNAHQTHKITINQIQNSTLNSNSVSVDMTKNIVFKNNQNYFKFMCSVPVFNEFSEIVYQYQLQGLSNTWSDWKSNGTVVFENLPYGKYSFKIKSKVNGKLSSNIAFYDFTIAKPWYLTTIMLLLYGVVIVLFSVFMHIIYKKHYAKQRERLLLKKQKEFELQKLENEQELTLLKNQKLEADVALKNKELASSTMNIIKKNELLNSIKKELLKGEPKNINTVLKIIDKSLKNTDDWKLFEEAFNNADKDFIKKIKTLHPSLTSNDLRLCAYLRLNLSSKEIAPLLNISAKSVEVKRYRLRKKMNLTNDENLVDHILSV